MTTEMSRTDRVAVYAVGVGLGYGALGQGGFYESQFVNVIICFAVAFATRLAARNWPATKLHRALVASPILLAIVAYISANIAGTNASANGYIAVCFCLATGIWCVLTWRKAAHELFTYILLIIGAVIAASSWYGVAFQHLPYAIPSQQIWRASSTLTYANATAAYLLGPIALVFARLRTDSRSLVLRLALMAYLVAWLLTFSRGGVIGLVLLAAAAMLNKRSRKLILDLWPIVVGVVVASAACVPSLREGHAAQPIAAIAGVLIAGAFVLIASNRRVTITKRAVVITVALLVGLSAAVATSSSLRHTSGQLASTRLNAKSTDRADLIRVTWNQFKDHPIVGVGPDNIDFDYVNSAGTPVHAEFTHNEFLQLATETGVIGLVALLILGLCLILTLRPLRANALAWGLLLAFAAQSGLDFLWHIPILELTTVMSVATLAFHADRDDPDAISLGVTNAT